MINRQKWQHHCSSFLLQAFHVVTSTVLTNLLPLSFILLARISCYNYLSAVLAGDPIHLTPLNPFLSYLFQYINPSLLYLLVSCTSVSTLVYALTGQIPFFCEFPARIRRPHLCFSWIMLCATQISVQLGAEWVVSAGIDGSTFESREKSFFSVMSKLAFFLGLHETMILWWRAVVKPVVDGSVFGEARGEKWPQRVATAASFGGLWWWKLRIEAEFLVMVAEYKNELKIGLGVADFVGWWLYYLTSTIGIVKVVKLVLWFGRVLILGRVGKMEIDHSGNYPRGREEKV